MRRYSSLDKSNAANHKNQIKFYGSQINNLFAGMRVGSVYTVCVYEFNGVLFFCYSAFRRVSREGQNVMFLAEVLIIIMLQ